MARKNFVRTSKFRHVFGTLWPKEESFENFNVTKNPWESNMCSVNEKFVAAAVESAGSFTVCQLEKPYRLDPDHPRVSGHTGPVLDLAWNPFNDYQIASCSEDTLVKIWNIPENGLTKNMDDKDKSQVLEYHQKKCGLLAWHPTAENILASAGHDCEVVIWNVVTKEPIFVLPQLDDIPCSICWNDNGSLLCTTSKDKKLRVFDPRTQAVISEGTCHEGSKPCKGVFCGKYIFTTGFCKPVDRQYALWDPNNLSKPLFVQTLDSASGVLLPFYDEGTRMIYLIGKGESIIRFFEITDTAPYVYFLANYNSKLKDSSKEAMRGAGCMPKRHLKFMECEVMRFYCLMTAGKAVQPLSMKVPRKSSQFQDDIFPPCYAGVPVLSAEEWQSGTTKEPKKLVITKDGATKLIDGEPSQSKLTTPSTPGNLSKQSSVSSNASEASTNLLKIERENSPISLTASGEFDDSQYRKEIQSLKEQVQALRQENDSLKKQVDKKDSIISGIKKLIN